MNDLKQISIGFSEKQIEMITAIMASKGYPTKSSVIRQAIIELHGHIFKDYVMVKQARIDNANKPKEEVAKSGQTDKFENICNELGGEIIDRKGVLCCDYYTYERKNRFKQEIPLASLDDTFIERQYFPSKEKVEKLQEEKRVSY